MNKQPIENPQHKLMIKVVDKSKKPYIDDYGNTIRFIKWVEVKEINLGSYKVPNKEILGVKWEPVEYEIDEDAAKKAVKKRFDDMFRGML